MRQAKRVLSWKRLLLLIWVLCRSACRSGREGFVEVLRSSRGCGLGWVWTSWCQGAGVLVCIGVYWTEEPRRGILGAVRVCVGGM